MRFQDVQRQIGYAERIGKVYGCFEVIDVQYHESTGKQKWTLRCVHCGALKTTLNGRDYVKGRNSGLCKCQRYAPKVSQKTQKQKKGRPDCNPGKSYPTEKAFASRHELYRRWEGIRSRCYSPKDKDYPNYGLRGITMCEEWRTDFWAFVSWAYASGYSKELTIDRIDSNGDYSPDNCCWTTRAKQNKNKRNVSLYDGKTLPDICAEKGLSERAVRSYVNTGMSLEDALSKAESVAKRRNFLSLCRSAQVNPDRVSRLVETGCLLEKAIKLEQEREERKYLELNGVRKKVTEWCREFGVKKETYEYRVRTMGMFPAEALTAVKYSVHLPRK